MPVFISFQEQFEFHHLSHFSFVSMEPILYYPSQTEILLSDRFAAFHTENVCNDASVSGSLTHKIPLGAGGAFAPIPVL